MIVDGDRRRLLVVSHPSVLAVNQLPYAELRDHGWEPSLVVPARWRNEYSGGPFAPEVLPELEGRVKPQPVLFPGRIQRHVYLVRCARIIDVARPHAAVVEAEATSFSALQWGLALRRAGVPFAIQAAENLDRVLPPVAKLNRRIILSGARLALARSPAAAELVQRYNRDLATALVPHHVPAWPIERRQSHARFVVGFAGRLVAAKGLELLLDAVSGIPDASLRLVGNGPLRGVLEARARQLGVDLRIDDSVRHARMARAYAEFDVLVLPSLTTPVWTEQFGRVLVEAMCCGVPVVGSSAGEIPWVIETTGGGIIFPEGDQRALRAALLRLRESPELRARLASEGRARAESIFGVRAVGGRLAEAIDALVGEPARAVLR